MDGDVQQVYHLMSFRTRFGIYALYPAQMLKQVQHDRIQLMLKQVQHDNTFWSVPTIGCKRFQSEKKFKFIKKIRTITYENKNPRLL
ncbi:MAG TPA: hypothetical protein DEO40_01975 [Treponema sp.]|nr:hypothetical protein [Treponema sp.]